MTVSAIIERATQPAEIPCEQTPQEAQVVRSAGIVSAAVFLSRLTGLLREMVMANQFGAGFVHDSFLLGFRIPNLSRDLFAEGALSSAFVPTFTKSLVKGNKLQASELANLVTTAILVIVGACCLLGMWLAPLLVGLLAPGFAAVPGKFALAVRLTRIMFPFLLFIALSAQATGMLNAGGKFGLPAVASIFFNIGSIGFGLLAGYVVGPHLGIPPIEGMAYGVVAGGALQFGWQRAKLHALGYRFRFAWNWSHPGLRRIFSLMLPAIVGNAAVQLNLIVNTNFASQLIDPVRGHDGPVSWLGYALRFVQLPLGLFGVAFASAMLPSVSRSAADNNFAEFRRTLARSLGMVFFLTIPCSLFLMTLGRPLIGAVYQSGHFNSYDSQQTALALSCYSLGLVAFASARVLTPAFYALSDARTPMLISLCSIAANIVLPLVLLRLCHLGFEALAITTSCAVGLECLCLAACLRRKLSALEAPPRGTDRTDPIVPTVPIVPRARSSEGCFLRACFLRIALASLFMALPLLAFHRWFVGEFAETRAANCAELALSIPLALGIFFAAARFLRVEQLRFAFEAFASTAFKPRSNTHAKIQT